MLFLCWCVFVSECFVFDFVVETSVVQIWERNGVFIGPWRHSATLSFTAATAQPEWKTVRPTVQCMEHWLDMLICDGPVANRRPTYCYLLTATIDQSCRRATHYRWKLTPRRYSSELHLYLLHTLIHRWTSWHREILTGININVSRLFVVLEPNPSIFAYKISILPC